MCISLSAGCLPTCLLEPIESVCVFPGPTCFLASVTFAAGFVCAFAISLLGWLSVCKLLARSLAVVFSRCLVAKLAARAWLFIFCLCLVRLSFRAFVGTCVFCVARDVCLRGCVFAHLRTHVCVCVICHVSLPCNCVFRRFPGTCKCPKKSEAAIEHGGS